MPLKTDSIEEPNLNLTPMIDIVFLLVIFFMVGARFSEIERRLDVKLPTVSDVEALSQTPDALVVNVLEDGVIEFDGEQCDVEQLETLLAAARENFEEQSVLVRGDREGRYQYVMDVLAACNRAGIQRISLANRTAENRGDQR